MQDKSNHKSPGNQSEPLPESAIPEDAPPSTAEQVRPAVDVASLPGSQGAANSFGRFMSLLYQPSILLLGAATVLAFVALSLFYPNPPSIDFQDPRFVIWIVWGFLFVFILLWRALSWYLSPPKDIAKNKDIIDLYTKIATSGLLIASISVAWLSLRITQRATDRNLELAKTTLENNQRQQVEERFTRALEKLGSKTEYERIAGITAFKYIAAPYKSEGDYLALELLAESEEEQAAMQAQKAEERANHARIMEILTTLVLENAVWKEGKMESLVTVKPKGDITQILRFIEERKVFYGCGEDKPVILAGTDLRKYKFNPGSNFEGALFKKAHLENAVLSGVNLKQASFKEAHLQGTDLSNADLTLVDFDQTHLEGADLTDAIGVKDYQLKVAITDRTTKCPSNLENKGGRCVKK